MLNLGNLCEIDTKSHAIAHIYGTASCEASECRANARLIAAAPDMADALREIESKLTSLLCERVLDSTLPEFYAVRDARNAARAAIAKATGQA